MDESNIKGLESNVNDFNAMSALRNPYTEGYMCFTPELAAGVPKGPYKLAAMADFNPFEERTRDAFSVGYNIMTRYPRDPNAEKPKSWRERKIERTRQLQLEQQQGKRARKSANATTLSVHLRDLAISTPPPPTKTHQKRRRTRRVGNNAFPPVTNEVIHTQAAPSWVPPLPKVAGPSTQMPSSVSPILKVDAPSSYVPSWVPSKIPGSGHPFKCRPRPTKSSSRNSDRSTRKQWKTS